MERTKKRIESAIFDLQAIRNHAYLNANVKEVLRVVVEDLEALKIELSQFATDLSTGPDSEVLCACIERISWRAVLLLMNESDADVELP